MPPRNSLDGLGLFSCCVLSLSYNLKFENNLIKYLLWVNKPLYLSKARPRGKQTAKKGVTKASFCVVSLSSQSNPSKRSKLSEIRLIAVGRNKTKTIIVSFIPELSFLLRSSIGSNTISTFFLMHTFTGF